jgi:hypothetical protein
MIGTQRGHGYYINPQWKVEKGPDGAFVLTDRSRTAVNRAAGLLAEAAHPAPAPAPGRPAPAPGGAVLPPGGRLEEVLGAVLAALSQTPGDLRLLWSTAAVFPLPPPLEAAWRQAIGEALAAGRWVRDLWVLEGDQPEQALALVKDCLSWLRHRHYALRIRRGPAGGAPTGFAVGKALVCLVWPPDAGIVLTAPAQVEEFVGVHQRLWDEGRPPLDVFSARDPEEDRKFTMELVAVEEEPGERRFVSRYLSVLTLPPRDHFDWVAWWQKHPPGRRDNSWQYGEEHLDLRWRRIEQFWAQLEAGHRHRDLISRRWLEAYAQGEEHPDQPPALVAARLAWISTLLERYPAYELGLAEPQDLEATAGEDWPWPYWEQKGDTVLFEIGEEHEAVWQDRWVAQTFAALFDSIWERGRFSERRRETREALARARALASARAQG